MLWQELSVLAFAELGPRHGFGAVALLFGDIDAEFCEVQRRLIDVVCEHFSFGKSLKLSTASAGNTLARMP